VAAVLLALSAACSSSTDGTSTSGPPYVPPPQGDAGILAPCQTNNDCASDLCQYGAAGNYCSAYCPGGGSCPAGLACQVGAGACMVPCTSSSLCAQCACPSGQLCSEGVGCVPLAEVGQPCTQDSACKSQNCGADARVCDVPIGSPCNASNCELCLTWTNGVSYCSRPCTTQNDCNGYGGVCAGGGGSYQCYPQCKSNVDPSCGDRCELLSDASALICTCNNNCTTTFQLSAVGGPCIDDAGCASGVCFLGICTSACSTDADCGAGNACVACGAGCGNQCFETCGTTSCVAGTCNTAGTRAAGGAVSFCDPHRPLGGSCSKATDCTSGRCGAGSTCIPPSGIPSGQPCTSSPQDCASGGCCNSNCC
jgi:hypothetical protein